jgi:S-adenosylmethionine decarboxylase
MFQKKISEREKLKLSGFNNLTKVLSFNLYDFCITFNEQQRSEYINYINERYSAENITMIAQKICSIIDAEVLGISKQNYAPVGASSMVLMSDVKGAGCPIKGSDVSMHLDKSHITAHTYPDAADPNGICSFRVDIDIATCGEIIPLNAINYLFESFCTDVVYVDYVIRGYTRLEDGSKIYNDQYFNSIQDFINQETLELFEFRTDLNMPKENIWQTKLKVKVTDPQRFLLHSEDRNNSELKYKLQLLEQEMTAVFNMIH